MQLPLWPPDASGTIPATGGRFAIHPHQVIIKDVVRIVKSRIDFTGQFGKELVSYSFATPDESIAEKLATILKNNMGNTVLSIGIIEIPAD